MNVNRVHELEEDLLQALRVGFAVLCHYDGGGSSLRGGRNLNIGMHRVMVELRPVRSEQGGERHALMVKTPLTPVKTFRETRAGWFVVRNIALHLAAMLQIEKAAHQTATRQRQLHQTARNNVQRLAAQGLPEGCALAPSTKLPGGLDLTVQGLSEPAMRQVLGLVATLIHKPDVSTGLWAHLHADEDDA